MIKGDNKISYDNIKFKTYQLILLFFIFLFAMNFVNRYFYCAFIAFAIFICFTKRITYGVPIAILFGISLSLIFFSSDTTSKITIIIKPFVYPLCFIMGSSFFNNDKSVFDANRENKISIAIYVIAIGLLIHFFLNFIINIGSEDRNTIDFWVRGVMSATGQSALACIPIAVSCAWLVSNTTKKKKILATFILVFILLYNLILSGRTIILITLACLILSIIHFILKGEKEKKTNTLITFILIITIIFAAINFNFFGLRDNIINSNLYGRFWGEWKQEITDDGRFDSKLIYLQRFFDNLWGGSYIRKDIGYAHDLYLDTYDNAGIFALVFILIYVINSIGRFIKVIRDKSVAFNFKQIIFCLLIVFNIEFFVEPILFGMPWFFASYCFIDGLLYSYIPFKKRQNRELLRVKNENS